MSDRESSGGSQADGPDGHAGRPPSELDASLRRLRRWLLVLTLLVALLVAAMIVAAVLVPRAIRDDQQQAAYEMPFGPTAEQVASTREELETALGDRLEGLDVRLVTMEFDDPSMPADTPEQSFIYVQYRLSGSDVLVADIVGGPFGNDPASMGMLPTQGSLQSRMTQGQFDRLLAAYGRETSAPLSNVRRYNDRVETMMPGSVQSVTVQVGKQKYEVSDLWAATEGMEVAGDTVGMDVWSTDRRALIFYEDPKTGEFTFLGTEPALGGY